MNYKLVYESIEHYMNKYNVNEYFTYRIDNIIVSLKDIKVVIEVCDKNTKELKNIDFIVTTTDDDDVFGDFISFIKQYNREIKLNKILK